MDSANRNLTPTTPRQASELQNLDSRQAPQNTNQAAEIEFVIAGREGVKERATDDFAAFLNSQQQVSELRNLNLQAGRYDPVNEILNQAALEGPRSQGDEPF